MRRLVLLGPSAFVARFALAQRGPMITDDPGTPGNGKWEINVPIAFEHRPRGMGTAPGIDLNYGVGDYIQLTLQTAVGLLKQSDHGLIGGLCATEAAVKWRCVDEDENGFALSTFPGVLFNLVHSSVQRGLVDPGTRFQVLVEISEDVWRLRAWARVRLAHRHRRPR